MLRRCTSETNPADWFALAAERLRGADVLWQEEGLTGLGIEGLHESVERYLKGYLIAKGWVLVKTHDLERLVREAAILDPAFARFLPLAIELTEDFFAQHYPGEDLTHAGQNYEGLRRQADDLVSVIRLGLPQCFPSPPAAASTDNPDTSTDKC